MVNMNLIGNVSLTSTTEKTKKKKDALTYIIGILK